VANQADQIQEAVCALIREEVGGLRTFVDRRIAELSAEVHATTQLMDFSESHLTDRLAGIREQISGVLAAPTAATRNSGFELEAVVQATEEAANRIMEAAEAIGDWLREGTTDAVSVAAMNDKVAAIFEACSFQDVTGQRIRRAIQHLQQVETMLTGLTPNDMGPPEAEKVVVDAPFISRGVGNEAASAADPDLAQDAVDSLFD
jgi:chemotaxis protein CheZ